MAATRQLDLLTLFAKRKRPRVHPTNLSNSDTENGAEMTQGDPRITSDTELDHLDSGGSKGGRGRARPSLKSCPPFYYLHLTRHTVTSGSLLDGHNARASRSKRLKSASDRRSCLARECARTNNCNNNKIDRF